MSNTPIIFDFDALFAATRTPNAEPEPEAVPYCQNCENGGWECYGTGRNDPHFRECQVCFNPEDLPCP